MKRTLLILIIALSVASCGNKKSDKVAKNSDEKLVCTTKKAIGSNIPEKTCRTIAERKEERKKNQEQMREAKNTRTGN